MTPQKDCSTTKEPIKSQKNKTKMNGENARASAVPSLKCEICKDVVSNQRQLIVHRNRFHSNTTPLTCDLCNSSFTLQSLYEEHINSKHNTSKVVQQPPDFSCDKCEFVSKRKGALTRHNNEAHNAKKILFECPECTYSSNRKENLKVHIKNVHRKSKNFVCLLCTAVYQDKLQLDQHLISSHSKGSRYKCIFCEFATSQKNALNQHIKVSHDAKSTFTCDQCNLSYKRKDSLSKHIRERHSNGFILKKSDQIKTAITDNSSLINRSFSLSDISVQSKATEKVKFWLENNDFKVNPYDIECY